MLLVSLLRILLTRSFKPFLFEGRFGSLLEYEALEDLGLYVHIPFCLSLCGFCPYCKEIYDVGKADAYRKALMKEIDLVCADRAKKSVNSLYFGGGTPAMMIDDLKCIIEKLKQYFVIDGGIGVELHPDDISEVTLKKLKAAGVTMVSIGIQSFDADCLAKLGRRSDGIFEKLKLVRDACFEIVDMDLIFAIPGQTNEKLAYDISTAFGQGATQVSTYPFIDFTFAKNIYKPMNTKVKKRMLKSLAEFCRSIGTERTSVWTFARKGTGKYSSVTRSAFLGFGVSAATLLQSSFKINTFSIDGYIERITEGFLPTSLTLDFTKRQRAAYFLFWSAYAMRIDSSKFEKMIGSPLQKMYRFELFAAEKLGYLRKIDCDYELTEKASYMYHDIEQVYTTAYIDKMWNVSRLQAFPAEIVLR